jgi:hypothetical protein
MQAQGRPDLTQRGRDIDPRPGHAQPEIPSLRPRASLSGASAAGRLDGPNAHESPPLRQPFTGVTTPGTLAP